MSANSFGSRFTVTTFGESHGPALGVIVDGCPAGISWRPEVLAHQLERRRPGGGLVSARSEEDAPEVLSGVYQSMTLGTPIAVIVRNQDARSQDYAQLAARPGHADDVWKLKFGHSDPRGGGRASGRETVSRVIAGAIARMVLAERVSALKIEGFARSIGPLHATDAEVEQYSAQADQFPARMPSPSQSSAVETLLTQAKLEGKSYGGVAEIRVKNPPVGLGQPVFHKLKADWASALLGVGATFSIEIGDDASSPETEGSVFHAQGEAPYGGIRGGISTGSTLVARVGFKPTASVMNVAKKGRHDPCIVVRAIPVLEAMTAIVLADHFIWSQTDRASGLE